MRRLEGEEREAARKRNLERQNDWRRKDRAADPEKYRAKQRAYFGGHRVETRARQTAETARLRAAAIEAYGGKCSCPGCHVSHIKLLTLDHVEAVHHRQSGKSRGSTRSLYYWLRKNGYPLGFQVLCGSCNLAKSDKDSCPLAGQEH